MKGAQIYFYSNTFQFHPLYILDSHSLQHQPRLIFLTETSIETSIMLETWKIVVQNTQRIEWKKLD